MESAHYNGKYDNLSRFVSYFYQIKTILNCKPKSVLEIGIGNGLVSSYISKQKINVTTCDLNRELNPDILANISKLPIKSNQYDLVCAFQVLEHIPLKEVNNAIKEMKRVSKKYILISVPHVSFNLDILFRFPLMNYVFQLPFLRIFLSLPIPFLRKSKIEDHFWEIGRNNLSKRRFLTLFKGLKLVDSFRPPLNAYHHFFLFEK